MPTTFDPAARRIILDSAAASAIGIYSDWKSWVREGDNAKYLPAFRVVGGDPVGGGIFVASYFFLLNGWRIRPMEAGHQLTLSGNVSVDGGGAPVVNTLGAFNVSVQYTVPVQAQGISTGSAGGLTPEQALLLLRLAKIHGLVDGVPAVVTPTSRAAGDVVQTITEVGDQVTVAMQ